MARLIVFNDFIKSESKGHILESLDYISTREGVELNGLQDDTFMQYKNTLSPATAAKATTLKQKELITQLLYKFPDLKEDLPYEEYLKKQNMYTASQFISESFERLEELSFTNDDYVKYISHRPGVELNNGKHHGLFDATGDADLSSTKEELESHDGNVWRSIISLRRNDAENLDLESQKNWKNMINKHIPLLAKEMKIPEENFRWCAAFHNESYHPHIHIMYWSKEDHQGFCSRDTIEAFKSSLANDIFSNELWLHKEYKTEMRNELEKTFKENYMADFYDRVDPLQKEAMKVIPSVIIDDTKSLSELLSDKGSHSYNFQSKEVKDMTDLIVAKILSNQTMDPLFRSYVMAQKDIVSFYMQNDSKNMEKYIDNFVEKSIHPEKNDRKVLHNMVLSCAFEIKERDFIKNLSTDPNVYRLNSLIDNKEDISKIPKNIDKAAQSIYKFKMYMDGDIEKALDSVKQLVPDEEKRMELFLDLKSKENDVYNISMKDWKTLCYIYQLTYQTEPYIPVDNTLHSCTKLIQGITNFITNDTMDNEREAHRIYAIRREDEIMMKKANTKPDR